MRISNDIKATRKVNDIEQRNIGILDTRIQDSYVPIYYRGDDTALEHLSKALGSFNPTLLRLHAQEDDRRYRTEVAEGYALARKYAGQDMSLADFHELVREGKAPELRKLTKYNEHGINTFQMAEAAESMSAQMNKWYEEWTSPDGKRLADIADPLEFDRIYNQAESAFWQEKTGGQYDPKLFQKIYASQAAETRAGIFRKYLSGRAEMKLQQARATLSKYLDTSVRERFGTAEYIRNPGAWQAQSLAHIQQAVKLMASTTSEAEAKQAAAQYMVTMFNYANNPNDFKRMYNMMQQTDVYKDPTYRANIDNAYNNADKQYKYEQAQRRAEARAARMEARIRREEIAQAQAQKVLAGFTREQLDDPQVQEQLYKLSQQGNKEFNNALLNRLHVMRTVGPDAKMSANEYSLYIQQVGRDGYTLEDIQNNKRLSALQKDYAKMMLEQKNTSNIAAYDAMPQLGVILKQEGFDTKNMQDPYVLMAVNALSENHRLALSSGVAQYLATQNKSDFSNQEEKQKVLTELDQKWAIEKGPQAPQIIREEYRKQTAITMIDGDKANTELKYLNDLRLAAKKNSKQKAALDAVFNVIQTLGSNYANGQDIYKESVSDLIDNQFLGTTLTSMTQLADRDKWLAEAGLKLQDGTDVTNWSQIISLGVSAATVYHAEKRNKEEKARKNAEELYNRAVENRTDQ